jgi:hypothetical protein
MVTEWRSLNLRNRKLSFESFSKLAALQRLLFLGSEEIIFILLKPSGFSFALQYQADF